MHIRVNISNNTFFRNETNNIANIIQLTRDSIEDKFNNLNIHSTVYRTKRGLINGFGSIIKSITGNLDSEDGDKINTILEHLQNNQGNLQNQIKLQYSVSQQIIENFNKTIQDIQNNEIILTTKIFEIKSILDFQANAENIIYLKELFNELLITFNVILDRMETVENSLTFCKLRTLHPSIIKSHELFVELQKISSHYKAELPFELNYENILNFESVIGVTCKVEKNKIEYFLSIPIDYNIQFDLFYMLPIPTKIESEFVTLIPNTRYLLKSENLIKPLNDICTHSNIFHCPNHLQDNNNHLCEKQILLKGNSSKCHYIKINIENNNIEVIPEINQFLAVFPVEEKLIIKCARETETRILQGIYLIENSPCKIIFQNQELTFQDKTFGQPFIINKLNLEFNNLNISPMKINLKTLKLKEISMPVMESIPNKKFNFHSPSLWTVTIYIGILITILWTVYKKITLRRKKNKEPTEVQLPEGASF